jgi:anaerobic sulfite reductase subunit A
MEYVVDFTKITESRINMFGFLARLYKTEVDEELITILRVLPLPEDSSGDFNEGLISMKSFLSSPLIDPETDLAVDYAGTFLGAGKTETSQSAYPYESVYTSPEKLIMQDARDQVLAMYRKYNLDKSEQYKEPEDHIFFELEFMCELNRMLLNSEKKNMRNESIQILKTQKTFIKEHLLNWVPDFCEDVEKISETSFYKGLAKATLAYLWMDLDVINEMIAEFSNI